LVTLGGARLERNDEKLEARKQTTLTCVQHTLKRADLRKG